MHYIVGYTDTPGGADALALGVKLARGSDADLKLVMVLNDPARSVVVPADGNYEQLLATRSEQWLAEALDLVPDDVTASTHLLYAESFSQGLLLAAEADNADLIVIGAAGGGILGRIGSVANSLLHSSPVPVALAPAGYRNAVR